VEGRLLHSAYDPIREAETWAEAQVRQSEPGEVLVVLGVGLLYHVEALCRRLPPDTRLVVPVPDVRVLHDAWMARLLDPRLRRVHWLIGPAHQMAHTILAIGHPVRLIRYEPAAWLHAESYAALETTLREAIASRVSGRLHVAVVGPIYGGSLPIARYTVRALEALGHRVSWIDHSPHHGSLKELDAITDPRLKAMVQVKFSEVLGLATVARLAQDLPDVVLCLAQAPLTQPVLDHLRRKKLLTAMWFVENGRQQGYWPQVAAGYDYWFIIQRGDFANALRYAGAKQVHYLPMAADPELHRPLVLSPEEQAEFGADVAFVGAGYRNRRLLFPRLIGQGWTFKVWGDEWNGAEDLVPVLQRGGARIDPETCVKVFNATAVNVNLHSYVGSGFDPQADFVNPRTFELAACGAFQVVDQRIPLPELFAPDELVTVSSPDELLPTITKWLKEPQARVAIAQAARRRVLTSHTYVHRMKELLAHLGLKEPDRIGAILRGERNAESLTSRSQGMPALAARLRAFPPTQRVELEDLAAQIRAKGPEATLSREDLLILMLDEYRKERRDFL
jgi:spore maturation protein CgeB